MVADMIDRSSNPTIAPYASEGNSFLRITARAADRAQALALIEPVCTEIAARMGDNLYGFDDATRHLHCLIFFPVRIIALLSQNRVPEECSLRCWLTVPELQHHTWEV